MWSVLHVNKQQETIVMQQETDEGCEQPMTLFDVTHPGLAAVTVDLFFNTADFTPQNQRDRDWVRERPLKAFN